MTSWEVFERGQSGGKCGTTAGYSRHQYLGEKPCDACAAAKAAYDRRWRAASDNTKRNRIHANAQQRAYRALAAKYGDEYHQLYRQFRAELYAEHGIEARR